MAPEDNTEIDLRIVVCEIINWAELTQDRVYFIQEDFNIFYDRVFVAHPVACLPKCEVTSHI